MQNPLVSSLQAHYAALSTAHTQYDIAVFITYVISEVDSISWRQAIANRYIDSFLLSPYTPLPPLRQ
jgi:hypothetical protein